MWTPTRQACEFPLGRLRYCLIHGSSENITTGKFQRLVARRLCEQRSNTEQGTDAVAREADDLIAFPDEQVLVNRSRPIPVSAVWGLLDDAVSQIVQARVIAARRDNASTGPRRESRHRG